MKILALSDQVVDHVYSPAVRQRYPGVDLILGCGDLPAYYLEFIECQFNVPLLYVPGNHDSDQFRVPGGQDIDGRFVRVRDLALTGLGGSRRYKADGRHQYSEADMRLRLIPLLPRLLWRRLRYGHGADILVTHAPPRGIHDSSDLAHTGFETFRRLIRLIRPRLLVHGHVHLYSGKETRETRLDGTRILNVFPVQLIELEAVA
jgi:Icc-related predicted phosphoesterase